jgi:hypothetical protein
MQCVNTKSRLLSTKSTKKKKTKEKKEKKVLKNDDKIARSPVQDTPTQTTTKEKKETTSENQKQSQSSSDWFGESMTFAELSQLIAEARKNNELEVVVEDQTTELSEFKKNKKSKSKKQTSKSKSKQTQLSSDTEAELEELFNRPTSPPRNCNFFLSILLLISISVFATNS